MSGVKIKAGTGGGSTELQGPADTSNNTVLKLPSADGSANQLLKTDGSGNLGWATDTGGLFSSYALLEDEKTDTTNGGASTATTWHHRDLNSEVFDPDGIVSLSSNKFTIGPGTFYITWRCPGYRVAGQNSRLYNVSDSSVVKYGTAGLSYTVNTYAITHTFGSARVTISSGTKEYRIDHYTHAAYANGLGENSLGGATSNNIFTQVEIFKEA
ncbi:MAG: hypothetical protein CMM29_10100 [Rhodospirillaceae bacterium]|nr:hypothetical protein [Rhodospirillaceae bacterium]|tara:strand:- start:308 stop:946 length:639 start_codon:yes stop_codon:yes gene_type:complete